MKLTSRVKKLLVLVVAVLAVSTLAGCTAPRNADGTIKLIKTTTTFAETMGDENWFSAIFVWPLSQLINWLAPKISVGGAIIVVTVLVNGVLALATLKSTIGQQQMQLIQPELEKLQRKYEGRDDESSKMRQAAEMQALYRKYDINPAGTLLVAFIQLPVILAMYMSVQRSEAVQTGTFLGMDLQYTPMTGIKTALAGDAAGWMYLVLFIIMGVCQFLSMKTPELLQKKRAEALAAKHHRKPETAKNTQAKIMQYYMMGMIMIFGLMWPTAMSLYWAINSLVNVVKTLSVQKIIDNNNAKKEGAR